MCEQEAEINSHLFMHCKTAANLWNMFLCIIGISWVMPRTSFEMLQSWEEVGRRGSQEDWWRKCLVDLIERKKRKKP